MKYEMICKKCKGLNLRENKDRDKYDSETCIRCIRELRLKSYEEWDKAIPAKEVIQ